MYMQLAVHRRTHFRLLAAIVFAVIAVVAVIVIHCTMLHKFTVYTVSQQ
jgi:type IV secretory pathway component VirB8